MPTKGTTNTPIRFTEQDKAKVRSIQERYGLPSFAAAVRHAVNRFATYADAIDSALEKQSRKRA